MIFYSKQIGIFTNKHVLLEILEILIEGSLEVKLPTIWTVEKQR
jgi:hypothetical protein